MSETGKHVFRLRQLALAQAIWLLQVPALATGIGEQRRDGESLFERPAADRPLALLTGPGAAGGQPQGLQHLYAPSSPVTVTVPPAAVTLAQVATTRPTGTQKETPSPRTGVFGFERRITLSRVLPASARPAMYSLRNNPPAGLTWDATSPWVLIVPATLAVGGYTFAVRYSNTHGGRNASFRYVVLNPPRLTDWKLKQGRPTFELETTGPTHQNSICGGSFFGSGNGFSGGVNNGFRSYQFLAVYISYNGGNFRGPNFRNSGKNRICSAGGLSESYPVGSGGAQANVTARAGTGFGMLTVAIASSLADGVHSYGFEYRIGGSEKGGTRTGWLDHWFHASPFNITYIKSKVTIATPEVAAATAASGHKLGTLTLSQEVPGATWTVEGTPAVQVNLTPVVGSENEQVEVALAEAAALKSASPDFLTLTISTVSDVGSAATVSVSQAYTELKIEVQKSEGISADASGLDPLTRTSKTAELPVQLAGAPTGGNVTLTLTSATPTQVAVAPAALVFTPANWSEAQNATVSITDAALAIKGARNVDVEIAVHDASSSATNYRDIDPVMVSVPVNIVNAAPTLAISQRSRSIDENIGTSATTAAGTAIGAPIVAGDPDNQPDELTYGLAGISQFFGVDPATGQITLSAATNLNHEDTDQYMVTVSAQDNEDVPGRGLVTVVIAVNDVNEPPMLAALPDQTVIENVPATVAIAAAVDPDDGDTITYSAHPVPGSPGDSLPDGVAFVAGDPAFTFAASYATPEITLRVIASDSDNMQVHQDFVVRRRSGGRIVADTTALTALSRLNRQEVFVVQLDVQPQTQAVTVTLASLDDTDVELSPATMEFDRSDWNVAQSATVRLSDAGVTVKGNRVVSLSLGVHDQPNSDNYFQGSVPQTVAVQVANVNVAPVFDRAAVAAIDLSVDEHSGRLTQTADAAIGDPIVATDADSMNLAYTLVGAGSEFRINAGTGQLSVVAGANFNNERQSSYELVVQAADGETDSPGIAQVTVTVQIDDIAERPGNYSSHALTVSGRARNGITLGWNNNEYEAQFDEFDRASIVVSYGGGGYMGTLTLAADATSARLAGLVPGVGYALSLHWYSADGLAQDAAAVMSGVMTQANAAPVFDGDLRYSRPEDVGLAQTPAGTEVATVAATDADPISYSIRGGADAGLFAIDPASGVVRLVRTLTFDHEVKASYTFMVAATDTYGASATGALVLTITGVDESPSLPVQFAQPAVSGQETTFTVRMAVDPEDPDDVEYQAEQENGQPLPSWLTLDGMTGVFTAAAGAEEGTWRIRVQAMVASAGGSQIAGAALPVALNEPAVASERVFVLAVAAAGSTNSLPNFDSAVKSFNLDENQQFTAGHSVGTVAANDADTSDTLAYSLRGADARPFAIDPASGALSISEDVTFDRESKEGYRFVVDVVDGSGGVASTEVEVAIANDPEAPEFLAAQAVYRVVARTRREFFVSPAVDPEGETPTYTANVPAGGWLTFNAANLAFTVAANAPVGSHEVTLIARDSGGMSAEHVFAVGVQTAGNRAPAFAGAVVQFALVGRGGGQMTPGGTEIGMVTATDDDELTYRIVQQTGMVFRIDPQSGRIEVATDTAFAPGVYQFTVEADDGNGGVSRIMVEVEFMVRTAATVVAEQQEEDKVALVAIDRSIAASSADLIRRRLNEAEVTAMPGMPALAEAGQQQPAYMQMASAVEQWDDWRYDHDSEADRIERMSLRDFLYSRGFDLAVDGSGGQQRARVWGAGSRSSLSGSPENKGEQVVYDGDANLFMLGVEVALDPGRKAGFAIGRSRAELTLSGSGEQVEREIVSVHPYASFRTSEQVRLWVSGGYGGGDYIRINADEDRQNSNNAKYRSIAGGIETGMKQGGLDLVAGMQVIGVQNVLSARLPLPEIKSNFWRLQADFEVVRPMDLSADISFRPFVGIGLHRNGGVSWLNTSALDVIAGMSLNWTRGLSAELNSRWQANNDEVSERSLSGSISYDIDADGRGLMLSVSPSMASSLDAPFARGMSASAGYGLPVWLFADSGIATFSADLSYAESGLTESYGFRFAGRRLDVDLSAAGDAYSLSLQLR